MKCDDGYELKEGDVIYSSYGIPPKKIIGKLYKSGKQWRVSILTGDKPSDASLAGFRQNLGVFFKEQQSE